MATLAAPTVALAALVINQINYKNTQQRLKQKPTVAEMQQDVIAIKDDLEVMQSFLMDLSSKPGQSHMLKTYVRLVRDLAYDGEDCLQEFLLFLEQPPRASPKLLLTQDELATMLKNLRNKVNGIREKLRYCVDASGLSVQTGSGIGTQPLPLSRINSVAYGNAPLFGREMERSHLIKLISEQGEQCRVISIWGMVGIGKTALTKSVYESQELSCMFEQGAWVSVMRPFNLDDVLTSLARQLKVGNFSVLEQENSKALASRSLKSEESVKPLNGMRCIIVLDGVLSTEEWKLIKPYLLATNASRVIVTTTEASVAEHCSTAYKNIYKLQALDDAAALELFKSKLPNTITKLKMLQYIRAGNVPENDGSTSSSSNISKKVQEAIGDTELPEAIAKTVQFSTAVLDFLIPSPTSGLDMHGVEVPGGIGKVNALQTLGVVNVSAGRAMLTDLEKLIQLRKLGVTGINSKNSLNVLSAICKFTLLISLSMGSKGKPGLHGCLDHMFSPPKHLQSLKLYGNLVTLPTWINELQNLAKLKLQSTRLQYDLAMQVLEKLPHLSILRLLMESFQDKKLAFHFQRESFPSLTMLELAYQDGIKSVTIDEGAMPNLELLQIKYCIHVGKGIFSGLSFLRNLKEVVLKGDYDANFMDHLRTELALNPNKPVLTVA